jgi:methylmalonyl-CoA/ethylmalonyl-CoA epimerase
MKPAAIDHIGIAVKDLDAAVTSYATVLGLALHGRERVETRGIEVAFLTAGDDRIELLAPTRPDSEVSRFLEKRGEGVHHLCLAVEDIDAALAKLQAAGVRLIDSVARPGAEGGRVAFVHPSSCHGVLIELAEKPPRHGREKE